MEDALKVISTKFELSLDVLNRIGNESEDASSWLTILAAYVLDNDQKQEEQKSHEVLLRKQRLNAEHQLSQLEKQLISCNTKLSKYERNLLDARTKLSRNDETITDFERKYEETSKERKKLSEENEKLKKKYGHLEEEKFDFAESIEKKNNEIDRLNEEWKEMSKQLGEANKIRYELQYKHDEFKNADVRKEFKEKRLEQEKSMLLQQLDQVTSDLQTKTASVNELQKDQTSKILDLEGKLENYEQENLHLRTGLETVKKTSKEQGKKIELLMNKIQRASEEHIEAENNMQQELTAQTKLVQLYKDDRDHAKSKLTEVTTAISELQELLKQVNQEKLDLQSKLVSEEESNAIRIKNLEIKVNEQVAELENANDLLQISKKKGPDVAPDALTVLSPMAAASSRILKKGMTLTQIYSEYVKISDELLAEKEENSRLKMYMEQILREVEEKAPLLMQQKEDYEHARITIGNMSSKLEENIKECNRMKNEHSEFGRKINFHKREEKRLRLLCTDLSQQVRVLLKEVEEARGGVVSSSERLPELASSTSDLNASSSGQVISEHLVTFKSIEGLQAQNERLLLTVRELSEEQEKLEQEGGSEIIQELKKKIQDANTDLESLKENQKTQDDMMEKLCRQRDMYKVLCQKGGVMVGDISSTSTLGSQSLLETETELTKTKAELDNTLNEHAKLKEDVSIKEKSLNIKLSKLEEELSTLRMERDRLKNQLDFSDEKYSILTVTSDGYKKEGKALEAKCKSITEALNKVRVEAEKYKQEYHEAKEKLVAAEVSVKTSETEKRLIKDAEKRLMQENQSLLDQQKSQNVLLTNLQTIQNNLERQQFETRKTFGKQVDGLQREVRALRRQNNDDTHLLKATNSSLENELKELKIKLAVELEKSKLNAGQTESSQHRIEQLELKCKELQALSDAAEKRLHEVLDCEGNEGKKNFEHEIERYKTKERELELVVSNALAEKKAVEDQLEVSKKHIQQYQEIASSNEQAITVVNQKLEAVTEEYEKKLGEADEMIKRIKSQIANVLAEKIQLKKSTEQTEKQYQSTISELRTQAAPLERRLQEITRALVAAKALETSALTESQNQSKIAKEATDKYERELVLHAKDVEQLTKYKEELNVSRTRFDGIEEKLSEYKQTLQSNEALMQQMKDHHSGEQRKGEVARKDLIDQNAILHGQVEKLSAQLASAKTQSKAVEGEEKSDDKAIDEVYELLRFVRREKEIAETKAEASATESMRYRQRAEHLQRDLDETKAALELELERAKGRMLTEDEFKDLLEKVKKAKEFEELNKSLERQKSDGLRQLKILLEKVKKLEQDIKSLHESKKTLETEKNSWLAEKTALKVEIDRWTARTNQLMAQNVKSENEEVKKLQVIKVSNEKTIVALQDDVKRTKQQVEMLRRESLKLKGEKTENQNKITSLQNDLLTAQSNISKESMGNGSEQIAVLQKENGELKKQIEAKKTEMLEKSNLTMQLKKLARKYKSQTDKLQKLCRENNIDFSAVTTTQVPTTEETTSQQSASDQEEKKKLQVLVAEKEKALEEMNKQLRELQSKYDTDIASSTDKDNKFKETQSLYVEAEKKLLELRKETDVLKTELNEEKEKQEKNKKLVKTAKDKLTALSKNKEILSRVNEGLKKENTDLKSQLHSSNNEKTSIEGLKQEYETKINSFQVQIDKLMNENKILETRIDKLQEEKRYWSRYQALDKMMKVNQQKTRLPSTSSSKTIPIEHAPTLNEPAAAPLTATVRPTSAQSSPSTSKFHTQVTTTPTASIRPLAHSAPTAMINPTFPATQTSTQVTPIASVAALPSSTPAQPQVAEVQGRTSALRPLEERPGSSFKAPVARITVQTQELMDQPSTSTSDAQQPMASGANTAQTSKRSHAHMEHDDNSSEINVPEVEDERGSKRLRVDEIQPQDTEDSQDVLEEDELLGEGTEDGDDDVMETAVPTFSDTLTSQSSVTRETRLQMERGLQPSPQELLRQRSMPRGRSQLPSFSLMPGQGSSGYYEDTDDSTVPSTPTLFMPKRTDGFAEAVSSPSVRFPTFSFAQNEQPTGVSTAPTIEQRGIHLDEARGDLFVPEQQANVPQTPLSIVPSGTTQVSTTHSHTEQEAEPQGDMFFPEDNGQEQNVPQQIDLTEEDDDDDENDGQDIVREDVPETEQDEEAGELFAPEEEEEEEEDEEEESESEDSESSSENSNENEEDSVDNQQYEGDNNQDGDDDIVEIHVGDDDVENEFQDEQQQDSRATEQATEFQHDFPKYSSPDEKLTEDPMQQQEEALPITDEPTSSQHTVDEYQADRASASTLQFEETQPTKAEEPDKPKPVRLQRSNAGGRPRIRRTALPGRSTKQPEGTDKPT